MLDISQSDHRTHLTLPECYSLREPERTRLLKIYEQSATREKKKKKISRLMKWRKERAAFKGQHAPYTQAEIDDIIRVNNQYRRDEGASNMFEVTWNNSLADLALQRASKCHFAHGDTSWALLGKGVGQNLYYNTKDYEASKPSDVWYLKEKPLYNYDDKTCTGMCGHYTQLIWSSTRMIGYAKYYCEDLVSSTQHKSEVYYAVCDYYPAGNYVRTRPYKKGEGCTECDKGWCRDGLCVEGCPSGDKTCECNRECDHCGQLNNDCTCTCLAGYEGPTCSDIPDIDNAEYCPKDGCQRNCANCGKLTKDCECECPPGYLGPACAEHCLDLSDNCGTAWPKQICNYPKLRDKVTKKCPLMCGLCEAEDPAVTQNWCENKLTAVLSDLISNIDLPDFDMPQAQQFDMPQMPQLAMPQMQPFGMPNEVSDTGNSIPVMSDQPCGSSYEAIENYEGQPTSHSKDMPGVPDVELCLSTCSSSDDCKAADWMDSSTMKCRLHFTTDVSLKPSRSADVYKRIYCKGEEDCLDTFDKVSRKALRRARKVFGPKTLDECADMCRHRLRCVAFYFENTKTPRDDIRCWLFDDDDVIIMEKEGSSHYIKQRCSDTAECYITFQEMENKNSNNGNAHKAVKTVDDCMKMCEEMTSCTSFDYVTKEHPYMNTRCFTYDMNDVPKNRDQSVHYVKQVDCGGI